MSNGRNCDRDRATTLNVIEGRCRAVEEGANENWLGHGIHTGAAHIDELLFQGATYDELDQQAGRGAVDEHLRSLPPNTACPYTAPEAADSNSTTWS